MLGQQSLLDLETDTLSMKVAAEQVKSFICEPCKVNTASPPSAPLLRLFTQLFLSLEPSSLSKEPRELQVPSTWILAWSKRVFWASGQAWVANRQEQSHAHPHPVPCSPQHILYCIVDSECKSRDVLQSYFDLLGELMKFNVDAFKRFNKYINTDAKVRLAQGSAVFAAASVVWDPMGNEQMFTTPTLSCFELDPKNIKLKTLAGLQHPSSPAGRTGHLVYLTGRVVELRQISGPWPAAPASECHLCSSSRCSWSRSTARWWTPTCWCAVSLCHWTDSKTRWTWKVRQPRRQDKCVHYACQAPASIQELLNYLPRYLCAWGQVVVFSQPCWLLHDHAFFNEQVQHVSKWKSHLSLDQHSGVCWVPSFCFQSRT